MLHDRDFLDLFSQGLPVFLVISFILYEEQLIIFSKSNLGKFILLLLIALYTEKGFIYGLLMCLIIILFYLYTDNYVVDKESFISDMTLKYNDYIPKKSNKQQNTEFQFHTLYQPTYSVIKNKKHKKVRFREHGIFEDKHGIEHKLRSKCTRSNEPHINIPIDSGNPIVVHQNLVVHKL
jgi:hypothetical protein